MQLPAEMKENLLHIFAFACEVIWSIADKKSSGW